MQSWNSSVGLGKNRWKFSQDQLVSSQRFELGNSKGKEGAVPYS
jgi:hypothetical protein